LFDSKFSRGSDIFGNLILQPTFSDILKKLVDHYKIDLSPRKGAIKIMIQEELTKLSEADNDEDEDEDEDGDVEKRQPQPRAKVIV
jgi:protein DEK